MSANPLRIGLVAAATLALVVAFAPSARDPLEPTSDPLAAPGAAGLGLPGAPDAGAPPAPDGAQVPAPDLGVPDAGDLPVELPVDPDALVPTPPGPLRRVADAAARAVAAADELHAGLTNRMLAVRDVLPEPLRPLFFADLGPAGALAAAYCDFEAEGECWRAEGAATEAR